MRPLLIMSQKFCRTFEQNSGARFADGNICAGGEGVVELLDRDQAAAFIDDRNGAARSIFALGFSGSRGDHFLRAFRD